MSEKVRFAADVVYVLLVSVVRQRGDAAQCGGEGREGWVCARDGCVRGMGVCEGWACSRDGRTSGC